MPDLSNGKNTDFFFLEREDPEEAVRTIIELVKTKLPRHYQTTEIQVLTPMQRRVKHVGNKSFHLDQEVIDADSEEVKCHCLSVMVLYDLEEQKSILIPEKWAKAIRDFEGLNED